MNVRPCPDCVRLTLGCCSLEIAFDRSSRRGLLREKDSGVALRTGAGEAWEEDTSSAKELTEPREPNVSTEPRLGRFVELAVCRTPGVWFIV